MITKKYLTGLVVVTAIASFALAATVFAASNGSGMPMPWGGAGGQGRNGQMRSMMRSGVMGNVTAVSGTTLTVTSRGFGKNAVASTYTVDASNATVTKNGSSVSVSSITVGDSVFVQGAVNGTNVTATTIRDGIPQKGMKQKQKENGSAPAIQGNGQPVVMGTVSAVSGSTLMVTNSGNAIYTVDVSAAKIQKNGNDSTAISDIVVGDRVIVQGGVNGTSIAATTIVDQANAANGNNVNVPKSHPGFFGSVGQFFKHFFGF